MPVSVSVVVCLVGDALIYQLRLAVYDQSKTIVPTYNCLLYSTALSIMTLTTNTGAVAFVKGNCAQRTANNVGEYNLP